MESDRKTAMNTVTTLLGPVLLALVLGAFMGVAATVAALRGKDEQMDRLIRERDAYREENVILRDQMRAVEGAKPQP